MVARNIPNLKACIGFPEYFYEFLDKDIFQKFDLSTGKIDLARHSLAHGYAKQEDFTKAKALQPLLILNQILHAYMPTKEKPAPRLVHRFGCQDHAVKDFLRYRQLIKRIHRSLH